MTNTKLLSLFAITALLAGSITLGTNAFADDSIEVDWNLSAAVMPAPPYGTLDIPDSDTESELEVESSESGLVTLEGEMEELTPNTSYTVYVSKAYVPLTSWSGFYPGVGAFIFVTDSDGEAEWEVQVNPVSGFPEMSVWINVSGIGTLLISDNFTIPPPESDSEDDDDDEKDDDDDDVIGLPPNPTPGI